jgi:hypothetical protein
MNCFWELELSVVFVCIQNSCSCVNTRVFETTNVGSPKHDTAVNTNSRNNKGEVKPPCLTVVPTNENKTGITDRNTRTRQVHSYA